LIAIKLIQRIPKAERRGIPFPRLQYPFVQRTYPNPPKRKKTRIGNNIPIKKPQEKDLPQFSLALKKHESLV
jgi:hypothetical protein